MIYIHVDKKVKNYPYERIKNAVHEANIYYINRSNVNWGGYSIVQVELDLLSVATQSEHSYYHLLSGVDYPLKSQDYIHKFFLDHKGEEFIRYDPKCRVNEEFNDRVRYYYWLQDMIGRNKGKFIALCFHVEEKLLSIQKRLHVNRLKNTPYKVYKGTQWFSITHNMAIYLVENKRKIKRLCKHGLCVDEIFLQTMAMISPYRENIVDDSLRYIDWKRGNPYTFTDADYEELKSSDKLFARKFDEEASSEVVNKIYDTFFREE